MKLYEEFMIFHGYSWDKEARYARLLLFLGLKMGEWDFDPL
jgi:hypothetical protein